MMTKEQVADEIRRIEHKKKSKEFYEKKIEDGAYDPRRCYEQSCFAKINNVRCAILKETYPTGTCPFRKEKKK